MRIVPGIAIAGFGPVRTVLLVGEVPWAEMRIALDGASRSSAMLLRLLCRQRGLTPRFRELPHDAVLDAASGTTGALVIGDAGFAAAARFPYAVDLGAAWRDTTGLPFVYAAWTGAAGGSRPGRHRDPEAEPVRRASGARQHRTRLVGGARRRSGGLPALPERQHPLPARRRGAVRAGGVLRPRARAPSCCRAPSARGCSRPRARIAFGRRRRAVAIDRRAARRRRRRRSACRPTTRCACTPTRRRWSWAPPPTRAGRRCTRTARSPTSSTATSTTRTSA